MSESIQYASHKGKRILFVDDEPFILEALKRQLDDVFDVYTSTSGREALVLLQSGLRFDVIVADMRMPVMNGIEFLVQAREIDPTFVPMMLTGNTDRQTAVDALEKGMVFNFLVKPCKRDRMIKAIESCLQLQGLQKRIDSVFGFLGKAG
jgi:DNA-binding NtrC family response regulator